MSGLVLRRSVSFIELVDSCRSIPELVAACKILEQIWNAVEHLKLNQEQCKILRARCIYIFTVIRDNTQTLERPMRNRIIEEFTSVIKEINRLVNEWVNWALAKCIFHIDTSTTEIQRAMNQLDSYCQNFRTITQVQLSDLKTQMETAYEVDKIELERIVNSHREARGKVSEGLNALLMSMTAHSGGQSSAVAVISKQTTIQELVAHLISHGCQDLTGDIDFTAFGEYPVADGGFGNIYRGRLLNGTQVAVKTLRVFEAANEQNLRVLKHAAKEIHTWSKCRHSNVLGLLGLAIFRGRVGMVARWMNNGNLLRYLEKVPAANRCKLSADICEGLAYLHDIGIVHGDLKGTNVLISDDGVPLLTDFGNSLLEERTLQFTQSTDGGTLTMRWSAPELIMGSATHSKASDVYALGMTILETMTEAPPYNGKPERSIVYLVTYKRELPERPETHIPTNSDDGNRLWDLLVSCWSFEPEGRPSAEAVAQIMKTITQRGLIV